MSLKFKHLGNNQQFIGLDGLSYTKLAEFGDNCCGNGFNATLIAGQPASGNSYFPDNKEIFRDNHQLPYYDGQPEVSYFSDNFARDTADIDTATPIVGINGNFTGTYNTPGNYTIQKNTLYATEPVSTGMIFELQNQSSNELIQFDFMIEFDTTTLSSGDFFGMIGLANSGLDEYNYIGLLVNGAQGLDLVHGTHLSQEHISNDVFSSYIGKEIYINFWTAGSLPIPKTWFSAGDDNQYFQCIQNVSFQYTSYGPFFGVSSDNTNVGFKYISTIAVG